MRELRGDFRDIFNGFSVALDAKKLAVAFVGMLLTIGIISLALVVIPTAFWYKAYNKAFSLHTLSPSALLANIKPILYVIGFYLSLTAIWAYCGGVITRIAAINLTKDEGLELHDAMAFGSKKWLSFWSPFIVCILGFLFFFICNVAGGLVGRIPYAGEILLAVFLPLAILSGFIMTFILVGSLFGFHMFLPTIGVEGSDSFDAMSRSFSYLYGRPWHYIFYCFLTKIYGIVAIAFVWVFGWLMLLLGLGSGALGLGFEKFKHLFGDIIYGFIREQAANEPITYTIAGYIILIWMVIIIGFIFAYFLSYCFSSSTIIYLLMRKKVDEIEMKEVYEEKEDDEISLPPVGGETKTEETKKEEPPKTEESKT